MFSVTRTGLRRRRRFTRRRMPYAAGASSWPSSPESASEMSLVIMYNARLELQRPRQRVCVVVSASGGKHGVGGSVGADAVRRGSHIPTTTDGLHKRRESACRRQFCRRPALCRQTALLGARSRWMEPALARSDSEGLIALVSLSLTPRPRSRVATAIRWRLGRLGGAVTYGRYTRLMYQQPASLFHTPRSLD